jgi:tRNA(Ile)-lysidine synthase
VNASAHRIAELRRLLHTLPEIERGIVVAVSGGPDSIALLSALLESRTPQTPLIIAHLNHQLRGADSDADAAFVAELHAKLASRCTHLHVEIHSRAVADEAKQHSANLEGYARDVRYRWLAGVARKHTMRWIATGHNANDQAETVLQRVLRGTGLQGLRGIALRRQLEPGVEVMRPLLTWTRADVLAYLDERGQGYRVDATNDDRRLMRNRIRHELLPLLAEQYNPAIVALLGRLAEQAEETFAEEEAAARVLLEEVELPRAGAMIVLDRVKLAAATRPRVRQMFRWLWQREQWPRDDMPQAAWERLAAVVYAETAALDLPGTIRVRVRARVVQLWAMFATHQEP